MLVAAPQVCTHPPHTPALRVPTSHVKNAGVMRAFTSAPHLEYGNSLRSKGKGGINRGCLQQRTGPEQWVKACHA